MSNSEKYDLDRIFRLFLTISIVAVLFFLVYYLRTVLIPFAAAFIIAYILDPVVDFFENRKIPRILSILIVFILIGILFFLFFFYGIPYIYNELMAFGEILPKYIQDLYSFIQAKVAVISETAAYSEYVDTFLGKITENIQSS